MNLLDIIKLTKIIQSYKNQLKDMVRGEMIKALDVFTFKAFGGTFQFSFYITCMKDSVG